MKTFVRVTRHGTSLELIVTKELKEMGIGYGEWVQIDIQPAPFLNEEPKITKPSNVPDMTDMTDITQKNTDKPTPKEYTSPFIKHPKTNESNATNENVNLDAIADKIIKATPGNLPYTDAEYREMMRIYGVKERDVQTVLQLIKENKK